MGTVAARDLRNHTADVLSRVTEGEAVTITVHGEPVAELRAVQPGLPLYFERADLAARLGATQADPGLRADLQELAGDTTDELGAP